MTETSTLGIQTIHRIELFIVSLMLVAVVVELVRRGHLKERYALLWLSVSACGLVIGIFPSVLTTISAWLSVQLLTVLFVLYFILTFGLVLSFSVILSRLSERNRLLTQEVALLAQELKRIEKLLHEK